MFHVIYTTIRHLQSDLKFLEDQNFHYHELSYGINDFTTTK